MRRKFKDDEIVKALDICDKLNFFYGQRAGYELWFVKPVEVQDRDVKQFAEDMQFVKSVINRQKAEIDRLTEHNKILMDRVGNLVYECDCAKQEAIKEFAERLKQYCAPGGDFGDPCGVLTVTDRGIDHLAKEMTGENNGN